MCSVWYLVTNISEECAASIFRAEEIYIVVFSIMTHCSWYVVTGVSEGNIAVVFRIEEIDIEVFCSMTLCSLTHRTSVPNHPASRCHSPEGYSTILFLLWKPQILANGLLNFWPQGNPRSVFWTLRTQRCTPPNFRSNFLLGGSEINHFRVITVIISLVASGRGQWCAVLSPGVTTTASCPAKLQDKSTCGYYFFQSFSFFPTCVLESAADPKLKTVVSAVWAFSWNIGLAEYLLPHTSPSLTSLQGWRCGTLETDGCIVSIVIYYKRTVELCKPYLLFVNLSNLYSN